MMRSLSTGTEREGVLSNVGLIRPQGGKCLDNVKRWGGEGINSSLVGGEWGASHGSLVKQEGNYPGNTEGPGKGSVLGHGAGPVNSFLVGNLRSGG